jgi:hypothetical protein
MNTTLCAKIILLLGVLVTSIKASAQPHHHENDPHVHGVSEIQLAISDTDIKIKFESPASNIVGFEHAAVTIKEKAQLEYAKATLSDSKYLFTFNGASCQPESSVINVLGLSNSIDEGQPSKSHNEISVQYQFTCTSTEDLKNIEIDLFKKFPNISKVKVQWVSNMEQGMSILKPSNNKLIFGN